MVMHATPEPKSTLKIYAMQVTDICGLSELFPHLYLAMRLFVYTILPS